ncbi:DEAD/DEAH box helicase-like protein [Nitrobacter hamburgensis X14]|uniref:DEAD/DEAH box helicase-like protein n=1 Tax=Nitrobacter hamburgensis (strain DSM 10229 / NCIMB 13809 / X14) TaxID=323097 RepID=Q1QP52_NITHX|nr:DEAD/DEAH box helicase [Nitrobacter hamburgensis]ABE61995.1 DEAD/DEAH box helicase-like protein [Nitrobacter hamburgensis X14]
MQPLADKVWANPHFHAAARRLQRAWLSHDIGVGRDDRPGLEEIVRIVRASAILACSKTADHRDQAYRTMTSAFDLYGASELPLDQATRVVLARLGNFPALATRPSIRDAMPSLPASLITEELIVSDRRTITRRDRSVLLTHYQFGLWRRLVAGERVAVAAPTSAGKSFVLQNFIAARLEGSSPQTIVYIVPTRALIAQVSADVRKLLIIDDGTSGDVDVITVPVEAGQPLPRRAIYVLTQERLRMMLSAHPTFHAQIIIVDEAHSVGDGARGVLLQWTVDDLLQRLPTTQLLFASPGIRNLDVFGRMFDVDDITIMPSGDPTVAQNFLVAAFDDAEAGDLTVRYVEPARTLTEIGRLALGRRSVTRVEKQVNLAISLGQGASNIVYANGAGDAEHIALEIAGRLDRPPTARRQALAQLAAETVHWSYALVTCAKKGVAFHYSNMPTQIRTAVEEAVIRGDIDYLVCTTTLLQGVNLPAKNLFLCRPEKGDRVPLESVDFWNLAGRAGRLMKEFQGNIFLIDYDHWRKKPLDHPRDATVIPAVEAGLLQKGADLLRVIERPETQRREIDHVDAIFGRLLHEHFSGTLSKMLSRIPSYGDATPGSLALQKAIAEAAVDITLPTSVLRISPNISPHKQQALYQMLRLRAESTPASAMALIPKHPSDRDAYQSYADILEICHKIIEGRPDTSRLHRFLALIAVFWMRGRPLPQIVQNQLRRNPDRDRREIIRDTLELVEKRVRYQCVRLFSCYGAVLAEVLQDVNLPDAVKTLPSIPLFLELGASDKTTLSLMSNGLSRATATRLTPRAPSRDLETEDAMDWLRQAPVETYRLPALLLEEILEIRGDKAAVTPDDAERHREE